MRYINLHLTFGIDILLSFRGGMKKKEKKWDKERKGKGEKERGK